MAGAQTQLDFPKIYSIYDENINRFYLANEAEIVENLLGFARPDSDQAKNIQETAIKLAEAVSHRNKKTNALNAFLQEYDLSSQEGIVLMCIAEALLRIPDNQTMDDLIADKLAAGNWHSHLKESNSLFVNASTWALMLTGKMAEPPKEAVANIKNFFTHLVSRLGEPLIRTAINNAMSIMGHQFVMGRTIDKALKRSQNKANKPFRYSYDMLGEAALTKDDADNYQKAYADAIKSIGSSKSESEPLIARPSISVKLSALCPRYEYRQKQRAITELTDRLLSLCQLARREGISLTVDAEEADRLELSLAIFESVYRSSTLKDWLGLGLAVQAYQKRCLHVLNWLNEVALSEDKIIPVRLVKGAYWDSEIKHAQELGLADYPVFTRKSNTDVSYLACANFIFTNCHKLYPQFATHNAQTLAHIYHTAGDKNYEFQRLHGMGETLYADVVDPDKFNIPCRVYAPVGTYEDLLPYLVRRLLENGANTSFVNQANDSANIEDIVADPVTIVENLNEQIRHPKIPLPSQLFGAERPNSNGINFADDNVITPLLNNIKQTLYKQWTAKPTIGGKQLLGKKISITDPANPGSKIGQVYFADATTVKKALDTTEKAWPHWNATPATQRAAILEKAADLLEEYKPKLMALCIREAGKTIEDSHSEIREAIDFLRYYASSCRRYFGNYIELPGPTGESNRLQLQGRGIFICISPWNFPVAIYTGQIAAALAAGNCILAKPAEQTSLTAHLVTRLMYEAGVPEDVLAFLPGDGKTIGEAALSDQRITGVAFTGSTETAQLINQTLAQRGGAIPVLIAETGGQNVMIVDSTALPEQVVLDVVQSSFNSAGQRCSALRVLYLQEDIASRVITLLKGRMDELVIGDPINFTTDIGPVIDANAKNILEKHIDNISQLGKILHQCQLPESCTGNYFPPVVIKINNIAQLEREVFGPVLHIITYKPEDIDKIIDDINNSGYGLTLGIHSRIENRAEYIKNHIKVGNIYINRNMVGAVVGVQPFGGRGLSGTGPKAGGPYYLLRFATEQTYTINTTAIGGNASLLTL